MSIPQELFNEVFDHLFVSGGIDEILNLAKGTSPLKRTGTRFTQAQMKCWHEEIWQIVAEIKPASVRQFYYQCVVRGLIEKTENEYKRVAKALAHLRRTRAMPYDWLADATRWMRRPRSYDSLIEAIEQTARFYRRDALTRSSRYIEVWLEKEALSGVVVQETEKFDVPLMVARGFASLSFIHSSAENIKYESRPTTIYHLGDYDPSGQTAAKTIQRDLIELSGRDDLEFVQLAVLPEQILQWELPSRPTKKKGNTHAKDWDGDSTELDAIHPGTLRQLVGEAIAQHLPLGEVDALRVAEESEREALSMFASELGAYRDKADLLDALTKLMREDEI